MTRIPMLMLMMLVCPGTGCDDWQGQETRDGDATIDEPGTDTTLDTPAEIPIDFPVEYPPDLPPGVVQVDVLIVVDNSTAMNEEQAALRAALPHLVQELTNPTSGARAVTDLHVGVVSTDMGTGGYTIETCIDPVDGDDGVLQHMPSPTVSGCVSTYPAYLVYESETYDATQAGSVATGLGCIASMGDDGCGWEQALKAAVRALSDHCNPGGANEGFLRSTSILAILFMTSENDQSVAPGQEAIFDTMRTEFGPLNLRAFNNPEMLIPIETFIAMFEALRAYPERLVMGFIVGVPPGPDCEGSGEAITGCLSHPSMQEQEDTAMPGSLSTSCESAEGRGWPARRFVQMANHLGSRAVVRSICTADDSPAIQQFTLKIQTAIGP